MKKYFVSDVIVSHVGKNTDWKIWEFAFTVVVFIVIGVVANMVSQKMETTFVNVVVK